MIHIGICDDEPQHQKNAKIYCEKFFSTRNIEHDYVFFSSLKNILDYNSHYITVLLLDIEMNDPINGIQLMKRLQHSQIIRSIIFVSGYTDYVYESFGPKTIGFCPKPINTERFFPLLKSAIYNQSSEPIKFTNSSNGRIYEDDIIYIYATGHYINVVTHSSGTHLIVMDIKCAQELLQNTQIIRIHRSYMVNLSSVRDISNNSVSLLPNLAEITTLPVGRSYRNQVKSLYSEYLLNY